MILTYKKLGLIAASALCVVLTAGCNDTLRQFILPVPKPAGDPAVPAHAVVLSTNPATNGVGSVLHVDVSGDSVAGIASVGSNPVFLGKALLRVFVVNGDNTITTYPQLSPTPPFNIVTLPSTPPDAAKTPIFVATTAISNVFTANRDSDNVSVISAAGLAETQAIPMASGSHPVAIASGPASTKMYIVNNGTDDVTVVSSVDNTIVKKTIPMGAGAHPIWGVMANNGVQVFIVNQGGGGVQGSVKVIDTNLDIVIPCSGTGCDGSGGIAVGTTVGSQPNYAFYDSKLQRLYVTNTGENTVSVIKADGINLGVNPQIVPSRLANIPITSSSGAPTSVVALADGSKAYVALGMCPAGINHTTLPAQLTNCTGHEVAVIDATALAQIGSPISVGAGAVSIDAAGDSSRVFVVGAQAGNVSIIRTSTNQVTTQFSVPKQDPNCTSSCALQTPFSVRVFP